MKSYFALIALFFGLFSVSSAMNKQNSISKPESSISKISNSISKFSQIKEDGSVSLKIIPKSELKLSKSELSLSHFANKKIISLPLTQENIGTKVKKFLIENSVVTDEANLDLLSAKFGRKQWYLSFTQTHNDLRVLNTNTNLRIFENGSLTNVSSTYFSELTGRTNLNKVALIDTLGMKRVAIVGIDKINSAESLTFEFGKQNILPVFDSVLDKIDFRVVQEVGFFNKIGNISFICFIDAVTNELLIRRNRVHGYDFTFNSKIVEVEPNLPFVESTNFPYIKVEVDGTKYYSDSVGKIFSDIDLNNKLARVNFNSDTSISPTIKSKFNIYNGYDVTGSYWFDNVCKVSDGIIRNNDDTLLQRVAATHYNGFYKLNNRFLEIDSDFNYLDRGVGGYSIAYLIYDGTPFVVDEQTGDTIWINEEGIVNAMSWDNSITFYHPLSSTQQLGQMPSVFYHELGHSITSYIYSDFTGIDLYDGGVHEGLADVHSAIMLGYPDVFRGATPDYTPTVMDRTLKNTLKLGYDDIGESHYDGQILSGAHWDLAELTSIELMAELMHFTRFAVPDGLTTGKAFTCYLVDMLLTDDDDGNINNKTPHWNEIITAFDNHNISLETYLSHHYEHIPLEDTEDTTNSRLVELNFSESNFVTEQLNDIWLQYSTNTGIKDSVLMSKDIERFTAYIPSMSAGTLVRYYFTANSPFRDVAYSFELQPERKQYLYLVSFDTLYHDNASDSTYHRFSSENSCYWKRYFINDNMVEYFVPDKDKTGEGYVWGCKSGHYFENEFHDSVRLYTADIYFPMFNNKDNLVGKKMDYYISLYYSCFVDDLGTDANSSLVFSLSKDGEQTWKDIFVAHKTSSMPLIMPWERLLFNVYDYFDSFDSLVLRVRFNGEQNDYADRYPDIAQVAFIDDLNILVGNYYESIEELPTITNINISPNPTNTNITLTFALQNAGSLRVTLNNLLGQELIELHNSFVDAEIFTKTFSLEQLPKGIYYLNIFHNDNVKIEKIIKN